MTWLRNPDFSLRQLQYAVAVHEHDGFGRAAEACGVSQPSLSAQIAKLEDTLGVQLFERDGRGVRITAAGTEVLAQATTVLQAAHDLDQLARALVDPYASVLRIGVIPTVAPYLLPAIAEGIGDKAPALRVHWLELQTDRCEAMLADGQLDGMILADPPTRSGVEHDDLGWEPFLAVVPQADPAHDAVDNELLSHRKLLLLEDGHCLRDHTLAQCLTETVDESPYRGTSLATVVQMVASGFGVTVIPQTAAPQELGRAQVRALPFASGQVGHTLRIAWRAQSPRAEVVRELGGIVRDALAQALASAEPR